MRKLNQIIKTPAFVPLPHLQTTVQAIAESKPRFFSVFDMVQGYNQCSLAESSRNACSFSTKLFQYRFTKLTTGLRCAPSAFLTRLYDLFRNDLDNNMTLYLDDGLIHHQDFDSHLSFLSHIFKKLRQANLRINPRKSSFAAKKLQNK